ncbi:MAG: glycoside hydrolase family 88 protein [Breznakiellaceae bacterium]
MQDPFSIAEKTCETMMATYEASQLPPVGRFHYHQGVFLLGMEMIWHKTHKKEYFEYIKNWVDSIIIDEEHIEFNTDQADDVQAGILLFNLLAETGEKKYQKALDRIIKIYQGWSRTKEGAFWHKEDCPHQVWLDHIYMQGPLACRYGATFNKPEIFEPSLTHLDVMFKHCKDPKTGLLYHAWDESRKAPWADPETGCSPEFWGRAIGWVCAALPDMVEWLPVQHPKREQLIQWHKELVAAIVLFQDTTTGLWYQVLDKGDRTDNWIELSCSCLFTYGIAKGIRLGYLSPSYQEALKKSWKGISGRIIMDSRGMVQIPDICIGTGVGDYTHYVKRPRQVNDLHGVGAFLFACAELGSLQYLLSQ